MFAGDWLTFPKISSNHCGNLCISGFVIRQLSRSIILLGTHWYYTNKRGISATSLHCLLLSNVTTNVIHVYRYRQMGSQNPQLCPHVRLMLSQAKIEPLNSHVSTQCSQARKLESSMGTAVTHLSRKGSLGKSVFGRGKPTIQPRDDAVQTHQCFKCARNKYILYQLTSP